MKISDSMILALFATTNVYADVAAPSAPVGLLCVLIVGGGIVLIGFIVPLILKKIRNKK